MSCPSSRAPWPNGKALLSGRRIWQRLWVRVPSVSVFLFALPFFLPLFACLAPCLALPCSDAPRVRFVPVAHDTAWLSHVRLLPCRTPASRNMLARLVARPAARGLRARTLSIRRFSTAALPFTLSHSSRIVSPPPDVLSVSPLNVHRPPQSPLPVPDPPPHDHGPDACIAVSGNGLVLRRGGGRDQAM